MYLLFYNLNNTDNICVGVFKNKEDAILEMKKLQKFFKEEKVKNRNIILEEFDNKALFGKFPPEYSSFNIYIIKEITNVLGEECEEIIGVYDDKNDVNKYKNDGKYEIEEMLFIENLNVIL